MGGIDGDKGDPSVLHKRIEGIREKQDDEALKQVWGF